MKYGKLGLAADSGQTGMAYCRQHAPLTLNFMQIARYLPVDDPVRSYDVREPSSSIPAYPTRMEISDWYHTAAVAVGTSAAILGEDHYLL